MDNKEKAISLFKYIKELYALKYQTVYDVDSQVWSKYLSKIAEDKENITINFMDTTLEEVEEVSEEIVLIEVKKPEFENPPILPNVLLNWVNDDYDNYTKKLEKVDFVNIGETQVKFEDSEDRILKFNTYKKERDKWVKRQNTIEQTRAFFKELYLRYIDLQRDSESIELMIGQGLFVCDIDEEKSAKHPILLKKVALKFDALNNVISILETDMAPEIYTMLLQSIDFINHSTIKTLKSELEEQFYNPLDRIDTPNFLKRFIHGLHDSNKYIENPKDATKCKEKVILINEPVLFVRKRITGVAKALEEIISELDEKGELSPPLLNLVGENISQFSEVEEIEDVANALSSICGEDKDILLTKEANREQLEIAKQIENYNAVLVQGPPGTGKTHTIANLMGHFLAQGKSVLVTSHTKKALSVVKEKIVPQLQNLCVSVLDDNNKDMERSIDGITEYISSNSSKDLLEEIEKLQEERIEILSDLAQVRKEIFDIKHKEYEVITYEDEKYSTSQMAKFVYDNKEDLSYLAGKVTLGQPFPLSQAELISVYDINSIIKVEEEKELAQDLPDPSIMLLPSEFLSLIEDEKALIHESNITSSKYGLVINYENLTITLDGKPLCFNFDLNKIEDLNNYLAQNHINFNDISIWCTHAILDGKKGGGYTVTWQLLEVSNLASSSVASFLGKTISGNFEKTTTTVAIMTEIKNYLLENTLAHNLSFLKNNEWIQIYNELVVNGTIEDIPKRALISGKTITGNLSKTQDSINILNEIKSYLSKGKKINFITMLKEKSWKQICNEIKINGKEIETVEDCDVLIAICELDIKYKKIAEIWNNSISRCGGVSLESFGTDYEQSAVSYIEKIKGWQDIYNKIFINSKNLENADDCQMIIDICNLSVKRQELSMMWYDLIELHGGPSFADFGAEPELVALNQVEKIKFYISWYENVYLKLKEKISFSQINIDLLLSKNEYMSPIDEINEILQLVYLQLPEYINLITNIYSKLALINQKLDANRKVCMMKNSIICKNLEQAITSKDATLYSEYYTLLTNLYKKYFYASERKRIIEKIEMYAPDWADLLRNRVGIHGQKTPPENIIQAWKWKQFAGFIDEITKMPFEQLQYKSINLTKQLRKATSNLCEKSAWYHLICRIEEDISQKQALQGWKLTVKKIGKGTGKKAPALRKEAKKLMAKCQKAVPAWVMPVNKALESLEPKTNKFDIVIIDEASQSDISALAIIYLAKKIIIVGDDEQVSPSAVGLDVDKMENLSNMYIKDIIPNAHLYDMKSSLYDIAKTTFPTLMLKEHFRCVPQIIGYSNWLSYDYKIKPLRESSNVLVKPSLVPYYIENGERIENKKINEQEANNIVALIIACMEFDEYKKMTFGVISLLGDEQAKLIQNIAMEKIPLQDFEKRRILCGNAANFQGDERDVIFISLVDNNNSNSPLRIVSEGVGKSTKQRYNVAISRAKNQIWVIHSLNINADLKASDMRKNLIEYAENPDSFKNNIKTNNKINSQFIEEVASNLISKGFDVVKQWEVGSYFIDMVVISGSKKVAIELDGELYNNSNNIREDMERQAVLERLGWQFIRIRGSEYYSNPENVMDDVIKKLLSLNIKQSSSTKTYDTSHDLKEKVILRAKEILLKWEEETK